MLTWSRCAEPALTSANVKRFIKFAADGKVGRVLTLHFTDPVCIFQPSSHTRCSTAQQGLTSSMMPASHVQAEVQGNDVVAPPFLEVFLDFIDVLDNIPTRLGSDEMHVGVTYYIQAAVDAAEATTTPRQGSQTTGSRGEPVQVLRRPLSL